MRSVSDMRISPYTNCTKAMVRPRPQVDQGLSRLMHRDMPHRTGSKDKSGQGRRCRQTGGHPRLIVGISGASGVDLRRAPPGAVAAAAGRDASRHEPLGRGDAGARNRPESGRSARPRRRRPRDRRPRRADLVGLVPTIGMIVAPCSIRSMAEIATGATTTLLTRAADVTLKERRRLVLMVRETPLHTGHLRTMTALSEMGAVIAPPVPAFYAKPQTPRRDDRPDPRPHARPVRPRCRHGAPLGRAEPGARRAGQDAP